MLQAEDKTSGLDLVRDCFLDLTNFFLIFFLFENFSGFLDYLFRAILVTKKILKKQITQVEEIIPNQIQA